MKLNDKCSNYQFHETITMNCASKCPTSHKKYNDNFICANDYVDSKIDNTTNICVNEFNETLYYKEDFHMCVTKSTAPNNHHDPITKYCISSCQLNDY